MNTVRAVRTLRSVTRLSLRRCSVRSDDRHCAAGPVYDCLLDGCYIVHTVGYHFTAQWLLYVPPCLTFTNATFCPHSVFLWFLLISEQTAIISLYSIN